ncbi:hypothetical protein BX265_0008 [Streptomyces sp. TLI_235]|nr:hypothetical protein BX265_0008 [Streptomyces sp. TLI_235]
MECEYSASTCLAQNPSGSVSDSGASGIPNRSNGEPSSSCSLTESDSRPHVSIRGTGSVRCPGRLRLPQWISRWAAKRTATVTGTVTATPDSRPRLPRRCPCSIRRGDAPFEPADAVLCADGPVRSLVKLSLVASTGEAAAGAATRWPVGAWTPMGFGGAAAPRGGRPACTGRRRHLVAAARRRILCHTCGRGADRHRAAAGAGVSRVAPALPSCGESARRGRRSGATARPVSGGAPHVPSPPGPVRPRYSLVHSGTPDTPPGTGNLTRSVGPRTRGCGPPRR